MPRSYEPLGYNTAPTAPDVQPRRALGLHRIGVSGRGSALVVGGLLLLAAVLLPLVVRRAMWLDAEAALVGWFVIWTGALWWLGYHGRPVERDWPDYAPLWGDRKHRGSSGWDALGGLDFGGLDAGDGCAGLLIGLVLLAFAVILFGFLVPLLAVVLFTVMRALLGQAGRYADRVEGRALAALAVAAGWAAVYTVPLAIAVWALHVLA